MSGCAVNSGPLSIRSAAGQPYTATSSLSTRTTRRLGNDMPIAISKPSRLPSSMIVRRHLSTVVQRVAHEIERPRVIQHRRRGERLADAPRHASRRPPRQIESERAIDAMHMLVIPRTLERPQPMKELPEAPARLHRHKFGQRRDHRRVATTSRRWRLIVRRAREPHDAAGVRHRELMRLHQGVDHLPLRGRRYSFRWSTSLMAAFSSARSAYIRFNFVFSASSSRRRFTSATVAPPYLLRHLKNVLRLMPCFRMTSPTATPPSASFKISTIWDSVNLDFRIPAPCREQST